MNKKTFVLPKDLIHQVRKMDPALAGQWFLYILEIQNSDTPPAAPSVTIDLVTEPLIHFFKENEDKYNKAIEQKINAGKASAAKRANGSQRKPTEANKITEEKKHKGEHFTTHSHFINQRQYVMTRTQVMNQDNFNKIAHRYNLSLDKEGLLFSDKEASKYFAGLEKWTLSWIDKSPEYKGYDIAKKPSAPKNGQNIIDYSKYETA